MIKKNKGSGVLILSLMAAMLSGMVAVGIAKSTSAFMNGAKSTEIGIQAQNYAESKMKYLTFRGYANLAEQGRAIISGTNFQDNVVIGNVINEGNGLSSRQVTVNVFKTGEAGSRATISRKFYSNDANMYVLNENSPTDNLSLKYGNSRYFVKRNAGNDEKLLTNYTPVYSGDLNNLTETGFFNGANLGSAPDSSWYYIENIRHSNMSNYYIDQKATNFNNGKIYHRQCRNGAWSSWEEFGGGNKFSYWWNNFPSSGTAPCDGIIVASSGWNSSLAIYTSGVERLLTSGRSKYGQGYVSFSCPVMRGESYSVSGARYIHFLAMGG